jgi:hypothetical protein
MSIQAQLDSIEKLQNYLISLSMQTMSKDKPKNDSITIPEFIPVFNEIP